MTYEQWESAIPSVIRADALWKMQAYRLALFLSDLGWVDGKKLLKQRASAEHGDQIIGATAKISACVAEGYSRGTGKERAHFYEYALGSSREARDWYYKSHQVLKQAVVAHRRDLCSSVIKLLIKMAANERRQNVRLTPGTRARLSSVNHQSPIT